MKVKILGVPEEVILKYGAVSLETAREMANRIRILSNSDIGLSATGIAGPGGATPTKPVGLAYVGLSIGKSAEAMEYRFKGNRLQIKRKAANAALELLEKKLKEIYGGE